MREEEQIVGDSANMLVSADGLVIGQSARRCHFASGRHRGIRCVRVNPANEVRDFGAHPMLNFERFERYLVVHEPFKQGDSQIEAPGKFNRCGFRLQLLVVADEYQLLDFSQMP